jgi:hypothetical protein
VRHVENGSGDFVLVRQSLVCGFQSFGPPSNESVNVGFDFSRSCNHVFFSEVMLESRWLLKQLVPEWPVTLGGSWFHSPNTLVIVRLILATLDATEILYWPHSEHVVGKEVIFLDDSGDFVIPEVVKVVVRVVVPTKPLSEASCLAESGCSKRKVS